MNNTLRIADAIAAIDSVFPLSTQDDWDNSGLIVGCADNQLTGILLTLDLTLATAKEAHAKGCNLIVAHHPILFRGLKRLTYSTDEQKLIAFAIKHDISLFAAHTCADKNINGTSGKLAQMLDLQDLSILAPDPSNTCGYGIVGEFAKPLSCEAFLQKLKDTFGCKCVRFSGEAPTIKRVAICTGSGSEFIGNALRAGAQAYITADVKYHQFSLPDGKMLIADIGHYESEALCKQLFFDILREKLSNFAPCLSECCSNPIKYF